MKKTTLLIAMAAAAVTMSAQTAVRPSVLVADKPAQVKAELNPVKEISAVALDRKAGASLKAATKATVTADFDVPAGLYTLGLNEERSAYPFNYYFGPAYRQYTWTNTSIGATSYVWGYQDPEFESEDPLTTTTTDLTVDYGWIGAMYGPKLTASDGTNSDTYSQWGETGNENALIYRFGGQPQNYNDEMMGASTYLGWGGANDAGYKFGSGLVLSFDRNPSTEYKPYYDANGTPTGWGDYFADVTTYSDFILDGFVNVYPKPLQTYSISRVWAWMPYVATAAAELKCYVVRVDDEGKFTNDTIAYSTMNVAAGSGDVVAFDLLSKDADGFESSDPINVNSSIGIIFTGFRQSAGIKEFSAVFGYGLQYNRNEGRPTFEGHAFCTFDALETASNERTTLFVDCPWIYALGDGSDGRYAAICDFMVQTDATYWWMESEVESYNFKDEGETISYQMSAYATSDAWTYDAPEWLTFTFADNLNADNEYTGVVDVTATAAALPAETTGRSADVKFSYPGAECTVKFSQGTGGVQSVVTSLSKVIVEGDNFVITSTADKAEIYNVAGQKVAEAAIDGTASIDAAGFANGLYIVKLSNGSAVKVVK